jgi:hypothetical protein
MFKLGSRLLITAVLLATALSLSGTEAGAQQTMPVDDISSGGGGTGGIVPISSTDSGEPDVGQTRDLPGGHCRAPGAEEQVGLFSEVQSASGALRWMTVIWALRYLGLGT